MILDIRDRFCAELESTECIILTTESTKAAVALVLESGDANVAVAGFEVADPEYVGIVLRDGREFWENVWSIDDRVAYALDLAELLRCYMCHEDISTSAAQIGLKTRQVAAEKLRDLLKIEH